jgi:H+/gluconate symporter-like permease
MLHTPLFRPRQDPLAAAANLDLGDQLGHVIIVGLFVSILTILAGVFWANRFRDYHLDDQEIESASPQTIDQKSTELTAQDYPSPYDGHSIARINGYLNCFFTKSAIAIVRC